VCRHARSQTVGLFFSRSFLYRGERAPHNPNTSPKHISLAAILFIQKLLKRIIIEWQLGTRRALSWKRIEINFGSIAIAHNTTYCASSNRSAYSRLRNSLFILSDSVFAVQPVVRQSLKVNAYRFGFNCGSDTKSRKGICATGGKYFEMISQM